MLLNTPAKIDQDEKNLENKLATSIGFLEYGMFKALIVTVTVMTL